MFNTPILDVALGLVFIFLVYSLLATSVQETIATIFALRARMLKKGIVDSMLSNTPDFGKIKSIGMGIIRFFYSAFGKNKNGIGYKFYSHPLLRNYGSSRIFPHPSYLPADNFCVVLLDILKKDFNEKVAKIAEFKSGKPSGDPENTALQQQLESSSDAVKIKELLEYYSAYYSKKLAEVPLPAIDKDTCEILLMHLRNSMYNLQEFSNKLESWFDDSMNRVAGWYKRQTQIILFIIGIVMAIAFNIDSIIIASKLSKDKDLREQTVKMAIASVDSYKDDPRVKYSPDTISKKDSASLEAARNKLRDMQNEFEHEANDINTLLAIGWDDYGRTYPFDTIKLADYRSEFDSLLQLTKTSVTNTLNKNDSTTTLIRVYNNHWFKLKVCYILNEITYGKKLLGLFITALAICLGAPFWFDLLGKLIKIRGAGKKEDEEEKKRKSDLSPSQPAIAGTNKAGEVR